MLGLGGLAACAGHDGDASSFELAAPIADSELGKYVRAECDAQVKALMDKTARWVAAVTAREGIWLAHLVHAN
jgi:hypothetical protein